MIPGPNSLHAVMTRSYTQTTMVRTELSTSSLYKPDLDGNFSQYLSVLSLIWSSMLLELVGDHIEHCVASILRYTLLQVQTQGPGSHILPSVG
jgi:hypothetical protein